MPQNNELSGPLDAGTVKQRNAEGKCIATVSSKEEFIEQVKRSLEKQESVIIFFDSFLDDYAQKTKQAFDIVEGFEANIQGNSIQIQTTEDITEEVMKGFQEQFFVIFPN